MKYSRITQEQFDEMEFDTGILLYNFDIDQPNIENEDIVCATTGGINLSVTPEYIDRGEDIYGMKPNTAEMMMLTGWTVEAEFTALTTNANFMRLLLGAADVNDSIIPRDELQAEDFNDIWWVGERIDGGTVAVRFLNSLSEDGISFKSQNKGSGQLSVRILAHGSLEENANAVPVEMYSKGVDPSFEIVNHIRLYAYGIPSSDSFKVNTETGHLIINSSGKYNYTVNENTGMMEVEKS